MRGRGFEPLQARGHIVLSDARLTAPTPPHKIIRVYGYLRLFRRSLSSSLITFIESLNISLGLI